MKRIPTLCVRTIPILLVLTGISFQSCQQTVDPPASDLLYFPLESGSFRTYEVTEQRFSLNTPPSSQTYQRYEVMTTDSGDASSNHSFRIFRYRRATEKDSWQPDSVVGVRLQDDQLIKTENNLAYIKLIFPVVQQKWDGNAYNTLGEDEYQLRHTGQPFRVLGQTFTETATVIQQNDSTLVNQDKRIEVYARNVGLIYKETAQLQFCSSTPSCVGKARIDYGFRQYVRLLSYGKQ